MVEGKRRDAIHSTHSHACCVALCFSCWWYFLHQVHCRHQRRRGPQSCGCLDFGSPDSVCSSQRPGSTLSVWLLKALSICVSILDLQLCSWQNTHTLHSLCCVAFILWMRVFIYLFIYILFIYLFSFTKLGGQKVADRCAGLQKELPARGD